ncbi:MAG: trigger factor [Oscillospiraceae bacterium]|jgi:trigger factor|nr:trigger factor [Oscillospiraceae bacterium]
MSLKSSTKVSNNRYELEVEVDAKAFEEAVQAAYRRDVKKLNIPGFRPGKAPRNIIEKMYGKEFFYEKAVNIVYGDALEAAIDEFGKETVKDNIELDVVSVGAEGLVFKAEITTKPEVELEKYKGLEGKTKEVLVTEAQVEEELEKVRDRNGRIITVEDRAAQNGDTVVFDFEGSVDGELFEGGSAEDFSLVLGSGQFIPGFEEQIVGKNIDDEFDVNVTFPEDYQAEELAGKAAVFKINLHEIKSKELPELDDEFAKDVSEFDTLDEYKESIKTGLKEKAEKDAKDSFLANVQTALIEQLDADIPEAMYNNRIDTMLEEMAHDLSRQGLNLEMYLQYTGGTLESLRESFLPRAERQVKLRLALEKVAELENIQATDEEVETELGKLAEEYKMDIETVKKAVDVKSFTMEVKVEKAMKLVEETAVAVQGE